MTHEQIQMWAEFNRIMAQQAARTIVQEVLAEKAQMEAQHDQWKALDNAWRIPLLHRAEIAVTIPSPRFN